MEFRSVIDVFLSFDGQRARKNTLDQVEIVRHSLSAFNISVADAPSTVRFSAIESPGLAELMAEGDMIPLVGEVAGRLRNLDV